MEKMIGRLKKFISRFVPVNYSRFVSLKRTVSTQKAQIDKLKEREKQLSLRLDALEKRVSNDERVAAALEARIGESEIRVHENESKFDQLEKRVSDNENTGARSDERINENRSALSELKKRFDIGERNETAREKRNRLSFYYARNANEWLKDEIKREKHDYYKSVLPARYKEELANWFMEKTGEKLELENPVTFNQKIQWLKIYDSTPLKTQLADKYLVRDFVRDKIGENYLVKLLGVWDDFDDIDFSAMPQKFVLKANHGCQFNYIVTDKSKFNSTDARRTFAKWLSFNYAFGNGIEPHYHNIKPRIIAEEYLENNDGLDDYKFWCFDGEPKFVQFLTDRNKDALKMVFYDTEWNRQEFVYNNPQLDREVPKPDNLEEMLRIARILSQGFCHVRVDLYRLNDGTLKFGEMTFTSASGAPRWDPPEWNEKMGSFITLPEKSPFPY